MPLDDIIKAFIGEAFLEAVFYSIVYWTGFIVVKLATFGQARIAPFLSYGDRNGRRIWSWGWTVQTPGGRALSAEWTCVIGIAFWITVGFCTYLVTRDTAPAIEQVTFSRSI